MARSEGKGLEGPAYAEEPLISFCHSRREYIRHLLQIARNDEPQLGVVYALPHFPDLHVGDNLCKLARSPKTSYRLSFHSTPSVTKRQFYPSTEYIAHRKTMPC